MKKLRRVGKLHTAKPLYKCFCGETAYGSDAWDRHKEKCKRWDFTRNPIRKDPS